MWTSLRLSPRQPAAPFAGFPSDIGKSNSGLVLAAWASSSKDHECAIRHARKQRDGAQNARIGRLPRQIQRSLIISGEGVGPCAVLQKASEEVAECFNTLAEVCDFNQLNDPTHMRVAVTATTLPAILGFPISHS